MENAVLLNKIINYNCDGFELYDFYKDATSNKFDTPAEHLQYLMTDLQKLIDYQYDFSWLTNTASTLKANGIECTRRDVQQVCDAISMMLGNTIEELCKYTKELIVSKPCSIKDSAIYTSESIVAYGNVNEKSTCRYDGKVYSIVETKLESNPYYNVYVSKLDI